MTDTLPPEAPPLSRQNLLDWLEAGCKPPSRWRVGTEHEKFGFCTDDLSPIPYEGERGVQRVLLGMAETFAWQKVEEGGQVIALQKGQAAITLEPGGQVELSGAPLSTIHQTQNEINEHLSQLAVVCRQMGVTFLGIGVQPKWPYEQIPWMPKGRYQVMRRYLPGKGKHGLDMMTRTATVQANLDYASESDMAEKFRLLMALQPVATALFANSPFLDGRPNGFQSMRAEIWRFTDPDRCGWLPFLFDESFGFERYVDYALDVPMFFLYKEGNYLDGGGLTFRQFMAAGKDPRRPGSPPVIQDWELHLSTLFPDVRLKQYLEARGADAGNSQSLCALPALWKGLLYDADARQAAWDLVARWTLEERAKIVEDVPRLGLRTPTPDGRTLQQLAWDLLEWAQAGLAAQNCRNGDGCDETIYLRKLFAIAESGVSPADRLLEAYHGRWKGSVDPVFREEEFESFFAKCH